MVYHILYVRPNNLFLHPGQDGGFGELIFNQPEDLDLAMPHLVTGTRMEFLEDSTNGFGKLQFRSSTGLLHVNEPFHKNGQVQKFTEIPLHIRNQGATLSSDAKKIDGSPDATRLRMTIKFPEPPSVEDCTVTVTGAVDREVKVSGVESPNFDKKIVTYQRAVQNAVLLESVCAPQQLQKIFVGTDNVGTLIHT